MRKTIIAAAAIVLAVNAASAANITMGTDNVGRPMISVRGLIVDGDRDAVRALVRPGVAGIKLDSAGGQLAEGILLADLVRDLKLPALVGRESVCYSVCAIIWLCSPERHANVSAEVGFHGVSLSSGAEDGWSLAFTTVVARKAKECGAPATIVSAIVTTPIDRIYFARIEDAAMLDVRFWRDNLDRPGSVLLGRGISGACSIEPTAYVCRTAGR